MAKMPNIVWSRLARKTPGSSAVHLDANLLAAFAEHTLLERERVEVSAHLAECVDCREYLAVAFAMEQPEAPAVARHPAHASVWGWFHEWRRIASAAAACCIVAAALQYYGEPPALISKRPVSVSVLPNAVEPKMIDARKTTQPITPPVPLTLARKQKVEPAGSIKPEAPVLAAKKELALQDVSTQSAPPTVTSAPSAQAADTALAVQRLEAPKADAVSSFVDPERAVAAPAAPSTQALSANSARVFGARPSLGGPASGLAVRTPLRVTERKNFALKSPAPESSRVLWSINASPDTAGNSRGVVQRSTDAGETWQIVPLSERISFRAVATAELDVWAGGSEGTLFHSSDGGSNWTETKVAGENAQMSGDIVRINARTPSQVIITTTTGEKWSSADRGKHWKRE
jgi:hypothetical protein